MPPQQYKSVTAGPQEASSILQSPLEQPPSPKKKKKADTEDDTHTHPSAPGGVGDTHGHMTPRRPGEAAGPERSGY